MRQLSVKWMLGVEVIDNHEDSSCLLKFQSGLGPNDACVLTLRVDKRASALVLGRNSSPVIQDTAFSASQPAPADSLAVTVTPPGPPLIAAGSYDPISKNPLIAVSTDSGGSWRYPREVTSPSTTPAFSFSSLNFGRLLGASCSGTECLMSGTYTQSVNDDSTVLPLVAVGTYSSSTLSWTWTYPTTVTNTRFVGGAFTSAAMSSS